ncbi:hypothetical protein CAPTEDRAFT_210704 [Capitella teleta]|uniref:Uncharacterized protein n=1 Tax=Capitella teleta TaxID=283909 RepID=R7UGE9_CAPTE|nr:hypothetical protein CAPTEDRAFT_210704 [Capitella teleta]|eukprot:ELU02868.1 hypothetical protein CAPTEDRAFT_210704 [Capitella teleta]
MKRKHKLSSAPCTDPPSSQYPLPPSSPACGDGDCGGPNGCGTPDECPAVFQTDHSPASTLVNSRESSREPAEEPSKKRNSLEIRNNIPEMGEVKSCDNSMDSFSHLLHAAPQMKKKSPGLARRLMSPERETSSSEREEEAPKDHHAREEPSPSKESPHLDTVYQREVEELTDSLRNSPERQNGLPVAADIENEYDYVKYARIQQGDSYVGMRLAYSTSSECVEDSTSPNKPSLNEIRDQQRVAALEETLTEIPLNGNAEHEEERRNFSLSPEATECDSAEVESVLSEEGRSSTSGMPFVEDGLSSSQGSDAEDHAPVEQPAEILKQKRIQEIEEQRLKKALEDSVSEISSQASDLESEEHQPSQEQLDMAIRDIRNAIQRSRAMQLQNTEGNLQETDSVEPVWVMSYDISYSIKELGDL